MLPEIWQTQVAKAEFSRLIKAALERGDQFISLRGEVVAVVISKNRYEALTKPKESLVEFFSKSPLPKVDLEIERSKDLPRESEL